MMLEWTRETLDNGLDVIVHEDHRCPIVAVNLWYHVGSRNESPGRTGLAHLFEHLMFEGSLHHDANYFTPLQQAGAPSTGRRAATARTTGRSSPRTPSISPCGSSPTAWGTCCRS